VGRKLPSPHKRRWAACLALTGWAILGLMGCSPAPLPMLEAELHETPTPSPLPTVVPTITPKPSPTIVPTDSPATASPPRTSPAGTPTGRPTATLTPISLASQHLTLARDGSILYGGLRGEDPQQIAQLEFAESWDMRAGKLALAQGNLVQMVDLVRGTHWSQHVEQGQTICTDVLWGNQGRDLLHVAVIEDGESHHVKLCVLDGETGGVLGARDLADAGAVIALLYDDIGGRVYLAVQGETGELTEVSVVPLLEERESTSYPIQGQLPASVDRKGQRLVYVSLDAASLCIQELGGGIPVRCVALPEGQLPTSYAWSDAGDVLAVMLQPNPAATTVQPEDAGLWVLSMNDPALHQVLGHEGPMSAVLGWSPGDELILARHSGGSIPDHVYLIRPDGGDRRILPQSERTVPLGWIPARTPDAPKVQLDPWPMRFASQSTDAKSLANTTARWLATTEGQGDDELSELLRGYISASGWETDLAGPQVVRVAEGLHVVHLPPLAVYVCEGGSAYAIASGQLIQDARYEGDRLAVIYATIGASSVTPGFALAERDGQGWRVAWTPQGQRYWVATDGEISFASEGLDRLKVRGSSFGLQPGAGDAFRECHACLHRWLQTEWVRTGSTYALANEAVASMPRDEALWALTERTPYAVLHETLRRLRLGQSASELASAHAMAQLVELGLTDSQRLLVGEQETEEVVLFSDLDIGVRYEAEVRQGKLVSVANATK